MRRSLLILLLVLFQVAQAQELNCNFVVNAQLTANENDQVFKTLERQLTEFINNTEWTGKIVKPQERINCSMVLTVQEYDNNDTFSATLQIQSSRPVFNSSYTTPLYNFNDTDFNFKYVQFQNLVYNENQYTSNLISVITFHVYMMLGIDADSFSEKGGDEYFRQAQVIMNYSQSNNAAGWRLEDGRQSRFALITDILSPTFKEYREVMYKYHINGLDLMSESLQKAKNNISRSVLSLNELHRRRPNSFLMRVFFDAKAQEVQDIFSGGPSVKVTDLVSTLNRIAPLHVSKWKEITF